ncbi:MAG: hypothetical protein J5495_03685, partial [Bacteroidales bacterium]|nr:hypothetical protein [Bacteroidales bacterium]
MEFLLSTLASYLAGNIPSIKKFFGLDKRLGWCFWKARNHWNEAAADRYKGKNKQLRADLVEFIQGNKPENDEELEQLLALWVAEIKKEKDGYDFIL